MLHRFADFLSDYLDDAGIAGLLRAALGILAFATLLSAIFGTTAVKAGALVIATLWLLGLLVVVTSRLSQLQSRTNRHGRLLAQYCQLLTDQQGVQWRTTRWDEVADVAKNGDVVGSITAYATTDSDALRFFRICLGSGRQQSEKEQRRVRVSVASFEVESQMATRWEDTSYWRSDGRLEILVHCLSEPPQRGQIRFHLDFTWPGKASPLMRLGEPDRFVAHFARAGAQLNYRVVLPPGTRARCDAIGFPQDSNNFTLSHFTALKGRPVVELVARDIPAHHSVGMLLDVR